MDSVNKQDNLVSALRTYGASHVQLTRAFAESLGLHPTDAGALAEIIHAEDRGAPISPAELATRLALSKPALSACLNRLEEVGHIVRTRESADRRIVTLRCDPRIYRHAEKFFVDISSRMASIVEKLSDQDVELISSFLRDASAAVLEGNSMVE